MRTDLELCVRWRDYTLGVPFIFISKDEPVDEEGELAGEKRSVPPLSFSPRVYSYR